MTEKDSSISNKRLNPKNKSYLSKFLDTIDYVSNTCISWCQYIFSNNYNNDDQLNLFNQQNNNEYLLSQQDISAILEQGSKQVAIVTLYHDNTLDKGTQEVLTSAFSKQDNSPQYFIAHLLAHWACFAILKTEDKQYTVLYKNSYGSGPPQYLTGLLQKIVEEKKIEINIKYNKNFEQTDSVSCGLFALKNIQIIQSWLENSKNNIEDVIDKFCQYKDFCTQDLIPNLRKYYAQQYLLYNINQIKTNQNNITNDKLREELIENLSVHKYNTSLIEQITSAIQKLPSEATHSNIQSDANSILTRSNDADLNNNVAHCSIHKSWFSSLFNNIINAIKSCVTRTNNSDQTEATPVKLPNVDDNTTKFIYPLPTIYLQNILLHLNSLQLNCVGTITEVYSTDKTTNTRTVLIGASLEKEDTDNTSEEVD
ncbi:MAG: hypothetical protein H6909_02380 [Rickettsiaceae bacterium]|nr:hypothetical protein [Rickettsiaceae bacterium]